MGGRPDWTRLRQRPALHAHSAPQQRPFSGSAGTFGGVWTKLVWFVFGLGASWLVGRSPDASLQLYVWAANAAARGFYLQLGAEAVEQFEQSVPGGGTAPIVRMRWPRASRLV